MTVPPGPDASAATGIPTCFRHPGRETYVSCVRCGRPACPDCLRSAAVGQQCVDCVREGNRGIRQPRAIFGGRAISGAVVTWSLVAINVLVYLAEWVYPKTVDYGVMAGGPAYDTALHRVIGVAAGDWYRLLSGAFLHEPGLSGFGPAHIIFNMWALIVVGPFLERTLGRLRFASLYLLSALGGSVLYYLLAPPAHFALGASGAIFGLFGAWFVLSRRLRLDSRQVIMLIVLNLGITFVFRNAIAWQDHVGGLVAGALLTAAYVYAPRQGRALIQAAATLALLVILVVAVVIRDQQLVGAVRF